MAFGGLKIARSYRYVPSMLFWHGYEDGTLDFAA